MSKFVTVQRIAEASGKLAQFVQHKGFKLRPAPFFSCCFPGRDHGCHIFYRILSVKNHTFEIQILKGFQHFPVIFSHLSAQMDLTVHPLLPKIHDQRRIRQNKTLKVKFHTASDDIFDHRILLRDVIQGIKGQMYRTFIYLTHARQNLQFTVSAQLHLITEHFPAV